MKVAYFGNDWHIGCLDVFVQYGHSIGHIFINGKQPYNQEIRQYAQLHQIPLTFDKPTESQMMSLFEQGVDCLFSIEYAWLIPIVPQMNHLVTMNVHPSLLPHGRGTTPVSWVINQYPEHAGITFHKLSNQFDTGDIIYQQALELASDESFETLMTKLHILTPQLLKHVLGDLTSLYQNAKSQALGSTWPKMTIEDRFIHWDMSTDQVKALAAACGRFGVAVNLENHTMLINKLEVGKISHHYQNGEIIRQDDASYVVALFDGFVILMKHNIIEKVPKSVK